MVQKQKYIYNGQELVGAVRPGDTLLDVAERANFPLHHSCGGMGTCGTCRIIVRQGLEKIGPPGAVELEIIKDRRFLTTERLACQNEPKEGLLVEIPLPLKD
jgi:2Fe-2S ferredoxin